MDKKWFKLDTAGLIFPAIMNRKWSNVFRLSVTLKEDIDPEILQRAVDELKPRFPSLYVALRKGLFWNYLNHIKSKVKVREDYAYPLTHMSIRKLKRSCFRVLYFRNRIAVEFFHSITDGTGARVYLCSLLAHYLKLKYAINFRYNDLILNPNAEPSKEELEDSFYKHCNEYALPRKEERAYHIKGEKLDTDFNILTTALLPTDLLLAKAHEYNCTLTNFLTAVMIDSIIAIQKERKSKRHFKPVKITLPVNLRKLFNSNTLRNFSLAINVGVDPRKGEYNLQEICDSIKYQTAFLATKQNMSSAIYANVLPQKMRIVRIMPLSIKYLVMSYIYNASAEKGASLNVSNLGNTVLPKSISKYIKQMEFIIGVQKSYKNNCSVISINNITSINMIRTVKDSALEQKFFSKLVELGLPVEIDCNERYE